MPLLAFQSPWPYLSAAEEELSMISAGEHWPWKANLAYRIQVGGRIVRLVNVSCESYHPYLRKRFEMSDQEKNVEFRCPPSFTVLDEQTPRGDQLAPWFA